MDNKLTDSDEGYEVIFRSCITLPNGKVLYAKACGIRAFPIRVPKQ